MFPKLQATWTDGPSFPIDKPDAIASGYLVYQLDWRFCGKSRTHHGQSLDGKCPSTEVTFDDEPSQDALDL